MVTVNTSNHFQGISSDSGIYQIMGEAQMKYIYAAYSGVGLRTHLNHAFKVADHCDPLILADQSALRVLTGQVPRKDLYARVSGPRDPRSR